MSMFDRTQLYADNGLPRTKSLFVDMGPSKDNIMTFHDSSKPFVALKPLYIALTIDDPTESVFAETVFGDITYWTKLADAAFMDRHLKEWRHEADVKRKAKAFEYIVKEIKSDGRNAYSAAKFLIDEPWKPKGKASAASKSKSTAEAVPSHIVDLTARLRERNGK